MLLSCLPAFEAGDREALEAACRAHPEAADRLRAAFRAVAAMHDHAAVGTPESHESPRPRQLGRFEIEQELGRGGCGVVYLARDPDLDRQVALKVLAVSSTREALARFRREARALASIRDPHLVAIHDIGHSAGGVPYLAMDPIDGESLETLLRRAAGKDPRSLGPEDLHPAARGTDGRSYVVAAVRLAAKVAGALDAAHRAGVVHRDVKPGNILVDREGEPKLVDFGLARALGEVGMTRSGMILGTPLYMAPEQIAPARGAIGPRTDVYGLGATLYHCLTLRTPFDGETTQQILAQVARDDPPPARRLNPAVPRDLEAVVDKAMAKAPARRYATAGALRDDLERVLRREPVVARRPGLARRTVRLARRHPVVSVAVAAVVAALALWVWRVWDLRARGDAAFAAYDRAQALLVKRQREVDASSRRLGSFLDAAERRKITAEVRALERQRAGAERNLVLAIEEWTRALETCAGLKLLVPGLRADLARALAAHAHHARRRGQSAEAARLRERAGRVAGPGADLFHGSVTFSAEAAAGSPVVVHLFRYEPYETMAGRDEELPRLVPVPVTASGERLATAGGGGQESALEFQPGDVSIVITGVDDGSPAAREGLEPGDLIYRVGPWPARAGGVFVVHVQEDGVAGKVGVRSFDRVERVRYAGVDADVDRRIEEPWHWECLPWSWERRREAEVTVVFARLDGSTAAATFGFDPDPPSSSGNRGVIPTRAWLGARLPKAHTLEDSLGLTVADAAGLVMGAAAPEGGVTLWCLRRGEPCEVSLPAGARLGVRAELTANPLVRCAGNELKVGRSMRLHEGSYLAVASDRNGTTIRLPFVVRPGSRLEIKAAIPEEIPAGYVYVDAGAVRDGAGTEPPALEPFLISRLEVSMGEWIEFVNAQSNQTNFLPTLPTRKEEWGVVQDEDSSRWMISLMTTPNSALVGVRHGEIERYLGWLDARPQNRGRRFRMPTTTEWVLAAFGADGRDYSWGDRFDFRLCHSFYGRSVAHQRHVLMCEPRARFPTDESPYGLRDVTGGAAEWCKHADVHRTRGGAWELTNPLYFRRSHLHAPQESVPIRGVRLIVEIDR